ncbi:TM2 domain-containing protein [Vibrio vulnificus]|uniref:TM2 domain-containing protein n=1 Tax=Vibrio vulnificus TaxID=672 RepID=UPI001CDCB761|nr:TM2 domain-containing protein [Vibrio vulnificus]MCA3899653.1 TM2 domain-containing protein [Vibrio vulnificus]
MRLFEPIEQLEHNEELLRKQVKSLPEAQKKEFYDQQSKKLKDPDTYATLNWFFLGGFHHCYLGKYGLFILELALLTISVIGLILGHSSALIILSLLVIYELPHLFFSQKIARQHNYQLSCEIFNNVRRT